VSSDNDQEGVATEMSRLRDYTSRIVKGIHGWCSALPWNRVFIYDGADYLDKMKHDVNVLKGDAPTTATGQGQDGDEHLSDDELFHKYIRTITPRLSTRASTRIGMRDEEDGGESDEEPESITARAALTALSGIHREAKVVSQTLQNPQFIARSRLSAALGKLHTPREQVCKVTLMRGRVPRQSQAP